MATKVGYKIQLHQGVTQQDFLDLPALLRGDLPRYQQVLSLDPYKTRKVPSHSLKGALAGYRALEILWNGIAYRLVYRIYDAPAPRRVLVLSFAEHDPAYERAIARK
ncbi:hypothetical protein C8255_18365 [filamentous cyanobacterium CCP3]|nr:hypothetical protein C8255_18365 [filamentous cyanobacterium CCP3]